MSAKSIFRFAIVLLLVVVGVKNNVQHPAALAVNSDVNLQAQFANLNAEYFSGALPADTIVDWSLHDANYMGTTSVDPDLHFHIKLNPEFVRGERTVRLTLLHESCHIITHGQDVDSHGPAWQHCMLDLEIKHAFRDQLIDNWQDSQEQKGAQ